MESFKIEEIKHIIKPFSRRAGFRSEADISSICKVINNIKFLRHISEEKSSNSIFSTVAQVLTIEIFQQGDSIVNYGEFGNKFYILLLGELNVLIPVISPTRPSSQLDLRKSISRLSMIQTPEERQRIRLGKRSIKEINELEGPGILVGNKDAMQLDMNYLMKLGMVEDMKQVATLNPGDSFGELALLNDKPRAATIQAKTLSVLAVLSKEGFKEVLSHEAEKALKEKVNFLCALPIFKSSSRQSVQKLSFYFEELKFKKGQYIYKENSKCDHVYIIFEGEVQISQTKQNTSRKKIIVFPARFNSDSKPLLKLDNARDLRHGFQMQVVIKGRNEILGYETCINGDPVRHENCCCLSNQAIIYAIKSEVGFR